MADGGGGMAAPRQVMMKMVGIMERMVNIQAKVSKMYSVVGSSASRREVTNDKSKEILSLLSSSFVFLLLSLMARVRTLTV